MIEPMLNDKKVADVLGIHRVTVWAWVKAGKIPQPVRINSRTSRWRESAVEQWIAEKKVSTQQ